MCTLNEPLVSALLSTALLFPGQEGTQASLDRGGGDGVPRTLFVLAVPLSAAVQFAGRRLL